MIKFNKHNVTDTSTKSKAKVIYSLDGRTDGRSCVTIYDKEYGQDLSNLFPNDSKNDSDSRSDYFVTTTVRLFEDHPLYAKARVVAEAKAKASKEKWDAKWEKIEESYAPARAAEAAMLEEMKQILGE